MVINKWECQNNNINNDENINGNSKNRNILSLNIFQNAFYLRILLRVHIYSVSVLLRVLNVKC